MHGVPQFELPHQKEQKEYPKALGIAKILQALQKKDPAQRNEINEIRIKKYEL